MEGFTPGLEVPRRDCVIEEIAGGENEGVRVVLGRVAERAGMRDWIVVVVTGLILLEPGDGDLEGEDDGGFRERGRAELEETEDTLETAVEDEEAVEIVEDVENFRPTTGGLAATLPRAREEEAGLEMGLEEGPIRYTAVVFMV